MSVEDHRSRRRAIVRVIVRATNEERIYGESTGEVSAVQRSGRRPSRRASRDQLHAQLSAAREELRQVRQDHQHTRTQLGVVQAELDHARGMLQIQRESHEAAQAEHAFVLDVIKDRLRAVEKESQEAHDHFTTAQKLLGIEQHHNQLMLGHLEMAQTNLFLPLGLGTRRAWPVLGDGPRNVTRPSGLICAAPLAIMSAEESGDTLAL
ncbi:hypothetical protein PHYSODRAFT_298076 [Phytophthora sojae]|uniref:Uncharacterized protein n=1 Tax=Phytophthora sojae (strain P6497) TaxID=1094619 RepID=G4Z6K8_PHYSP|nr:hypothetical protein PHYSODRAFT_298076 [Phytophthora sojae]EGZ19578.1 hypothetical protein PHYSODRAFT_298076 [Phytophthora sojae]|eukprot:XP_009522295.1 hypothetical protein PHYSODRAFT_298076 [Phytophthora sojae]